MAKTIEDCTREYNEAKARGDWQGMQAANDAANAIRVQNGEEPRYATEDIQRVRQQSANGYTPINSWAAQMVDEDAFNGQVAKQQQYIRENPSAVTDHTREEYREQYGDIYDNAPYTTPADREVPEGESGADAGLMSSGDYAVIQHLKQVWADADANYKRAKDAGDGRTAQYWLEQRENAHLEVERVRANYNYSGGEDGSMYIDYDFSGLDVDSIRGEDDEDYSDDSYDDSYDDFDDDDDSRDDDSHGSYGDHVGDGTGNTLPQVQVEDYSQYLEELYAARQQAALAELEAAYQKNLAALDQTEAGIAGTYRSARNQTAADGELAERNFHEYAAASGLNNGTAGQAELARNVTLQNNLNTINAQQAGAVSDLQLQRAQAEIEYNNAIAQAQAEGDYELAAALYEEKTRVQELLLDWEIQQQKLELQWYQAQTGAQMDADELAFQQQKHEDSLRQAWQEYRNDVSAQQKQALAEYGEDFLKQGLMPSDEMLAAMGMTRGQAQSYIDSVLAGRK